MPDLVTHLCTALLPKALTGGRHTGAFAVGVALPDVAGRAPSMALERLLIGGWPVPSLALHPWSVFHTPLGALLLALLLAMMFPEADRRTIVGWLWAGVGLHFLLDLGQDHAGDGYLLLFPFWDRSFELGWFGSEATVGLAPWFAAVTAVAWGLRWAWNRRQAR